MKTLSLMVAILSLGAAGARADSAPANMQAGRDQLAAGSDNTTPNWGSPAAVSKWWPAIWTDAGGTRRMLWLHESDLPSGIAMDGRAQMPLYNLTCTAGRCTSALSSYTLNKQGSLFSNGSYLINVEGDTSNQVAAILGGNDEDLATRRAALTPGADGRVTVLDPAASSAAIAEAAAAAAAAVAASAPPSAATSDAVTEEDEAAVAEILSGAESVLPEADGGASTLDNAIVAGEDAVSTADAAAVVVDAAAAVAPVDGAAAPIEPTGASPVSDLQAEAPPSPERVPVTRRGLNLPDRIAAGVGLGWLGMIAAVMASATPLGIAAAALTMGGVGFGLASVFGSHQE